MKKMIILIVAIIIFIFATIFFIKGVDSDSSNNETPSTNEEVISVESSSEEPPIVAKISNEDPNESALANNLDEYDKTNKEQQQQFSITNIKLDKKDKYTKVSGKIKNLNSDKKEFIITIDFYDRLNKAIGSSSVTVKNLKKTSSTDFSIDIMNDNVSDKYEVYVEYIKK